MRRSGGQTPSFDQTTQVNLGGDLIQGGINGIGLCGQTFVAVDRSGTATNNNIYVVASVEPISASNGTDVMFARSTNGGSTFSAPQRINDDPINHNKWHIFGTPSVAPNGRIDVVWLDSRNAANNIDTQLFYSYSTDGGVTWAPDIAVSNSFSPQAGFPQNQKIGDYITIVSDSTGGNVAYAATFNVNPNAVGGHEQDVYYVRVFPSAALHLRRHLQCRNGDSDAYAYAYNYTYTYVYATTNTDAQDHADAERSSYSTTEAESLIH